MVTTGSTIRPSESTRVTILSRVNPHAFNSSRRFRELTPLPPPHSPTFAPRRFSFIIDVSLSSRFFLCLCRPLAPCSSPRWANPPAFFSFLSPVRHTFSESNLIQFNSSDQFRLTLSPRRTLIALPHSTRGSVRWEFESRGFVYRVERTRRCLSSAVCVSKKVSLKFVNFYVKCKRISVIFISLV